MSDELDRLSQQLARALDGRLDGPRVTLEQNDSGRLFAYIVSPSFENMEDSDRQALAWGAVLDNFDEGDQRRIEFIFTDAPSEIDVSTEPIVANPGA